MAFIRRRGNTTALIETYREGGDVKQRVISNLYGADTVQAAIEEIDRRLQAVMPWLEEMYHYTGRAAVLTGRGQPLQNKTRRKYNRWNKRAMHLQAQRARLLPYLNP